MNKYRFIWMALLIILALTLGGCGRAETVDVAPEPPVMEAPTAEAYPVDEPEVKPEVAYPAEEEAPEIEEPEEEVAPTPEEEAVDEEEARMLDLLAEKIGSCHALNFVLRQNKTREEWSTTIDRMIGYGAPINAEEKEIIIDFLVSRDQ